MAELDVALGRTLNALLDDKKYTTLQDILITMNPADIAAIFAELDQARLPLLYRLLPKELAAETFVEMEPEAQELLIRGFSDVELKEVLNELYVDDAVDIVEEMPASVVRRILRQADPEMRKQINELLRYPDDSAGSIMTTEFVSLRQDMTVAEAIKRIRRTGIDKETINTCYVTQDKRLIGVVSIRTLLLADDSEVVSDIMEENVISVSTMTDQEEVVQALGKYNFTAIPVVDGENRLVGIVTIDDALDVMEDEATEDINKMAAILPSDKPYLRQSVFELWRTRIPWLLLLLLSATFTGIILTKFEDALAARVVLVSFIPMLMGTAGNSGSQASVTVTRALSLGDIEFRDLPRIIWKEIRVAVLCGACLAVAAFFKVMLVDHFLMHNLAATVDVAFTIATTVLLIVIMAKVVGCVLPMIGQKLGFDPAVMATPLISTILDALSLLVYLTVAITFLHI